MRRGPERFESGATEAEAEPSGGPASTPAAGAAWCLEHLSSMRGGGKDTSLTVTVTNDRCGAAPTRTLSLLTLLLHAACMPSRTHAWPVLL